MTIELTTTVQIKNSSEARKQILLALGQNKCTITNETENTISAKRGSQLEMRTLGGMIVEPHVLPVTVEVHFSDEQITITAKDDLGIGFMIGMETKYHEAVQEIVQIVEQAVTAP